MVQLPLQIFNLADFASVLFQLLPQCRDLALGKLLLVIVKVLCWLIEIRLFELKLSVLVLQVIHDLVGDQSVA